MAGYFKKRLIPWTSQPQYPVPVDTSGRLFDPGKVSAIITPGAGSHLIDALSGKRYTQSANVSNWITKEGKGVAWTPAAESYIEIAADADDVLDTVNCTMIIATVRTAATLTAGITYGYVSTPSDNRCQLHLPYTNGILYWDFGTSTTGRVSVDVSSYMAAGTVNIWGVSAGKRGREIWNNSKLLASDVSKTAVRPATSEPFWVGSAAKSVAMAASSNVAPYHVDTLFFLSREELSQDALAELTGSPNRIFAPQERKIFVSVAGGTITADASITQDGNTSSGAVTLIIATDASITATGDTASSAATLTLSADASITQSGDTVTGASTLSIASDATITADGDTSASTSALTIAADASVSQAGDTATAASTIVIAADCSATQSGNTLTSAASLVADTITADAAITQADNTIAADGVLTVVAELSAAQASNAVSSTAALASDTITANADITQAGNTAAADGALTLSAGASITQDSNTITSAVSTNQWSSDTVTFTSAIRMSVSFTSAIRQQVNFTSAI